MKVTKDKETGFKPYQIVVSIETHEEQQTLLNFCNYNDSIPSYYKSISGCTFDKYKIVEQFMTQLHAELK